MTAVALHHLIDGPADGPVVLMLGSLGSDITMWDPQVAALSEKFRVVRADLRGHGRSPVPPGPYDIDDLADDVVALLDHLGVARAHLVGLSLGGMTALHVAACHPDRVDRLAVICSSALLGPASGWIDRAAAVRLDGTGSIANAVVSRWFTTGFQEANPQVVKMMEAMVAAMPDEGYAACCGVIERMDLRAELVDIAAPTMLIAGAEDPATSPHHLEDIASAVAGARCITLPAAAHLASFEQATAVNALLLLHLAAPDEQYEQGMRTRRSVLGDAHVDRAIVNTTPLSAPFQEFITRMAWGEVWSRPGLGRRERSLLTLALLTALGHENELAMHVRAAIGNGVTPDEIGEVLLHTAVYAGVPTANTALAIAQRVLDDLA